ncbi:MAG: hypothetical protein K2W95_02840 [Candidatus Obscuribacterales bacterium]|nr:hypothetical protein [Candidatus Obscuribacterales bacterium]
MVFAFTMHANITRLVNCGVFAAAAILTVNVSCFAQAPTVSDSAAASPKKTLVLTGGVEHSEKLPSFDERYRPGNKYIPLEGTIADRNVGIWYRIPKWMAAHIWGSEKRTEYYWEDLRTGKIRQEPFTFLARAQQSQGWQTDAKGDIWQYSAVPFITRTEGVDEFTIHLVSSMEPVETTPDRFVKRSRAVQIDVGVKDNVIRKVEQDEQIHIFAPIRDGVLRCDDSSKVFDMDGNPIRIEKAFEVQVRSQPYVPVNFNRGMDMRASFYHYLTEQGLTNLIPDQPAEAPVSSQFPPEVERLVK